MADTAPTRLKDFVFDLYQASRVSLRGEEVAQIYEGLKDITDKLFPSTPLPGQVAIANECGKDEFFLAFYKEMAVRHKIRDLKSNLLDMLEAWNIYQQLFQLVLSTNQAEFVLSIKWVSDILQEFVYQFQGFCQQRLNHRSADDLRHLQNNRSSWDLNTVVTILGNLVASGSQPGASATMSNFGASASIELARLQCLIGDFSASISTLSPATMTPAQAAVVSAAPPTFASVYFHIGVSQLMLHQYAHAIEIFTTVLLNTNALPRLSANTSRQSTLSQLQKTQDKCLALLAVAIALCPSCRVDDQVKEIVDAKLSEKIRRISNGDLSCLHEMFENSCPKFINPAIPADFTSTTEARVPNTFSQQVTSFVDGAKEGLQALKVLKYLQLYASVDLSKLAKILKCQESELIRHLESIKLNTSHGSASTANLSAGARTLDLRHQWEQSARVDYSVEDGVVASIVAPSRASRGSSLQSYYITSLKKHNDIANNISRAFRKAGL